jgi:hypothetical protein
MLAWNSLRLGDQSLVLLLHSPSTGFISWGGVAGTVRIWGSSPKHISSVGCKGRQRPLDSAALSPQILPSYWTVDSHNPSSFSLFNSSDQQPSHANYISPEWRNHEQKSGRMSGSMMQQHDLARQGPRTAPQRAW